MGPGVCGRPVLSRGLVYPWRRLRAAFTSSPSEQVTLSAVCVRHAREVARALLAAGASAVVASDRHAICDHLPVSQRQACWAHLERACETFIDRGGEAAQFVGAHAAGSVPDPKRPQGSEVV